MKKKKFTKKELQAIEDWKKLNAKWDKLPKFARASHPVSSTSLVLDLKPPPGRESTQSLPSRVTPGGDTPLKKSPEYTGTSMVGIVTLHKSVATPVFNHESAIDAARMRR